jgi:hypothetical protein
MNDVVNPKWPVIRGHASIVTIPEMEIIVLWKNQLDKAIAYLIENDIQFQWEPGDWGPSLMEPQSYKLIVYNVVYANNLLEFAKVLKECDPCYNDYD